MSYAYLLVSFCFAVTYIALLVVSFVLALRQRKLISVNSVVIITPVDDNAIGGITLDFPEDEVTPQQQPI